MKSAVWVAALSTLSCAGPGPDQSNDRLVRAAVAREFQLRVGETAELDDPNLRLSLVGVVEDSRCPPRVVCVWAGNGRVELRVLLQQEPEQRIVLNTNLEPETAQVGALVLRLVSLSEKPDPDTVPPNYVATFRLEPGP